MSESKPYTTTITDGGAWMYASGPDLVFAFISNTWDPKTQDQVRQAFESALEMPTIIKAAIKETAGVDVVNSLYLVDEPAMISAMNTINSMGLNVVSQSTAQGSGTPAAITTKFFTDVLSPLGGNVVSMTSYLVIQIANLQAQVNQSKITNTFGTVMG